MVDNQGETEKVKDGPFDMVKNVSSKQDVEVLDIDARLQELAQAAPPFYKNRNLISLYLRMVPGCLVPAVTLGFDGAMINGLQAVETWISCMHQPYPAVKLRKEKDMTLTTTDFNNPSGSLLGLMTSIIGVGAICATPFISMLGDRFGRRWGIWFGSAVMAVGGIIQGASVHSELTPHPRELGQYCPS